MAFRVSLSLHARTFVASGHPAWISMLAFLVLSASCAGPNPPSDSQSIRRRPPRLPEIRWIKTFDAGDLGSPSDAIALEDAGFLILGETWTREKGSSHWLRRMTESGETAWLREFPADKDLGYYNATASLRAWDGGYWIVGDLYDHCNGCSIWISKTDSQGVETNRKTLETTGRTFFAAAAAIPTRDGGFLTCGAKGHDAWLMKFDRSGETEWEKVFDRGKTEDALALAERDDGGFLVAADSGEYNKFGGGPSEVWVFLLTAAGEKSQEFAIQGRHPSLALGRGGNAVVAFNGEDFPMTRPTIVALDAKVQKTWERTLDTEPDEPGIGMTAAASDPSGDFYILDSHGGVPRITKLSAGGDVAWNLVLSKRGIAGFMDPTRILIRGEDILIVGMTMAGSDCEDLVVKLVQ